MSTSHRSIRVLSICLVASMTLVVTVEAHAGHGNNRNYNNNSYNADQRRRADEYIRQAKQREQYLANGIKQLEGQIPGMESAIQEAQGLLANANREVELVRPDVEAANEEVRAAARALTEIVQELEESQSSSSPLRAAKAEYDAARAAYGDRYDFIIKSPEFKKAYEKALQSPNKTARLPEVRKAWIDDNAELRQLAAVGKERKNAYEAIRQEVVFGDASWQAASADLQQARQADDELKNKARGVLSKKSNANNQFRRATSQLASVRNSIANAKRELESVKNARSRAEKQREQLNRNNNRNWNDRRRR